MNIAALRLPGAALGFGRTPAPLEIAVPRPCDGALDLLRRVAAEPRRWPDMPPDELAHLPALVRLGALYREESDPGRWRPTWMGRALLRAEDDG
jgi:hypothetical protein